MIGQSGERANLTIVGTPSSENRQRYFERARHPMQERVRPAHHDLSGMLGAAQEKAGAVLERENRQPGRTVPVPSLRLERR